jgi:OOP family OmpA-OmpF porin
MKKTLFLLILSFSTISIFSQKKVEAPAETEKKVEAPVVSKPVSITPVSDGIFAPKESNPFEIGISGGLHTIWGDISSRVGLNLDNSTFGFHIRKALSHHFSMRLQYNYGNATMKHEAPRYSGVGNGIGNLFGTPSQSLWFASSQAYSHTIALDQIFTLGNNSVYRSHPKVIFDLFVGPALVMYTTKLDLKDQSGNQYSWSAAESIFQSAITSDPVNGYSKGVADVARWMDNTLDNNYETYATNNGFKLKLFDMAVIPAVTFGAGAAVRISDKFNLGIEQRFVYLFDDYIDGERFNGGSASSGDLSQNNDMILNTTVKLNYNLAKKGTNALPKYWKNENDYIYRKVAGADNKKILNEAFADSDGDGVPNRLDQEEDSRTGCPVDTRGVMLDSDKDGILDCDDVEPYSPAGYPVDSKGKAIVPPPACCEEMKNMVPKEQTNTTNPACAETSIPSVKFAKNKYGISPEIANALKTIGEKMQNCPDMRLVVAGVNDRNSNNGKLNEQLSYNRANEVVNHLTEKFGISRDRFIVKFNQDGLGDKEADRAVMFRHAQNGELGNSNPPSPHPGLNAGSK